MGSTSTGIILAKETNNNGKLKANIDGVWYFTSRVDLSNAPVGSRIDFEWSAFGEGNKLKGLESWGLSPTQPTPQEIEAAKQSAAPKKAVWGGRGGGGRGSDRSLEIDLQCMRFVGQICAQAIEKGLAANEGQMQAWVRGAWTAISFTRALEGSAPAPANTHLPSVTPTAAGTPGQALQGGTSAQKPVQQQPTQQQPTQQQPGQRVRPTGLFGYGKKYKDTPWNVIETNSLTFFRDESNAPQEVKKKCDDELWFREEEKRRADQQKQPDPNPEDDWDDDIPFAWAALLPLGGLLVYVAKGMFQVWGA